MFFCSKNSKKFRLRKIIKFWIKLETTQIFLQDSYVETSQSYSIVVFHSKSKQRPKSAHENVEKYPQMRKTSMSSEMLATGGNNGNADENLNFIKEEIAPGMKFF